MINKSNKKRAWRFGYGTTAGAIALALLMLLGGSFLTNGTGTQSHAYNLGVELYETSQSEAALQQFDKSLTIYANSQHADWLTRQFRPPASTELAALAKAKIGNIYAQQKKIDLAIAAYSDSLRLNPGDYNVTGQTNRDAARFNAQAIDVKYNLELMLKAKTAAQSQHPGKQE